MRPPLEFVFEGGETATIPLADPNAAVAAANDIDVL